jgi:hypothetical protein
MTPSAAAGVEPGMKASICDTAAGPVAEGVVVTKVERGKTPAGTEKVTLTVLASGEDFNDLGRAKSTWRAIARDTCFPVTTTPAPPATEPAPAPTPPDSTPTPPPS